MTKMTTCVPFRALPLHAPRCAPTTGRDAKRVMGMDSLGALLNTHPGNPTFLGHIKKRSQC